MKTVEVLSTDGRLLIPYITLADSYWLRLRGLMFRKHLDEGQGLLLTRCNSIHCCFMRMPIDVCFLDREGVVVRVIHHMKPWRFSPIVRGAVSVLECPAGTAQRIGIEQGVRLVVK